MTADHPSMSAEGDSAEQLLIRIGQLTRQMLESMRELGLDKGIARAAQAIPDARDRLNYVAKMTERAAVRALNAVDLAQPIQDNLSIQAVELSERWDECSVTDPAVLQSAQLVSDTRSYLSQVPCRAQETSAQLMEIMMAQDFQDLTGQVIKKMMDLIKEMETQLLQLLVDNTPEEKRQEVGAGLLNGPRLKLGAPDTLDDQGQVDDLLASLGF